MLNFVMLSVVASYIPPSLTLGKSCYATFVKIEEKLEEYRRKRGREKERERERGREGGREGEIEKKKREKERERERKREKERERERDHRHEVNRRWGLVYSTFIPVPAAPEANVTKHFTMAIYCHSMAIP